MGPIGCAAAGRDSSEGRRSHAVTDRLDVISSGRGSRMSIRHAQTRVPSGPVLVRSGVVGILSAGIGALSCGGQTESSGVPPTTGTPTTTPAQDAGRASGRDSGRDAGHDSGSLDDATVSLTVDSGYMLGVYDATGRDAADALADAASDGYIFEPPCGKKAPPLRSPR